MALIGCMLVSIQNVLVSSDYREPFVNTSKMGLFTKYNISGSNQMLLVANIHALNFVSAAQKRDAKEAEAEKEGTLDVLKLPGKLFKKLF